jgi:hypothetical protein
MTKVYVDQQAWPGSGNLDFTDTSFGTVDAVLNIVTSCVTNDTNAIHGWMTVGFGIPGFNQVSLGHVSRSGRPTTTDTAHVGSVNSSLLALDHLGRLDGEADVSAITDGVRYTSSDFPTSNFLVTNVNFGGLGDVAVGTFTANSTENGNTDVSMGFKPNLIIFITNDSAIDESINNEARISMGFWCDKNGTQGKVQKGARWIDDHGVARASSNPNRMSYSDRPVGFTDNTGSGPTIEIFSADEAGNPSGFRATTRDAAASGETVAYLAMLVEDVAYWVGDIMVPSSTGNEDFTDMDLDPLLVLAVQGFANAEDTHAANNLTGSHVVWCCASDGTAYSHNVQSEFTSSGASTLCRSVTSAKPIEMRDHVGAEAMDATYVSNLGNGLRLNVTTSFGANTKRAQGLAFGPRSPRSFLDRYEHMPQPNPSLRM